METIQVMHDADSHVMETPDWFFQYADPDIRPKLNPLYVNTVKPGEADALDTYRRRHADPDYRERDAAEIWTRKNWSATGSFIREDRPVALDLLGFASQLVFNTFANGPLLKAEHGDDASFAYGIARAHNRAIADFCSVDKRLLAVGYVPLMDFDRAKSFAEEAIRLGINALLIASACPKGHSPSHIGLEPFWSIAEEAAVPVLLHVGGGGQLIDPAFFENGLPPVPDFHGGDGNFRSIDYMAIPYPVMQCLATLIIDGVLDRHPRLRIGVIEQGGSWLPGFIYSLNSAQEAFAKNEERLRRLELPAGEYISRQVRVTPYPHEDTGWIISQVGDDVCMFSSDYPHVEGGRNPLGRFRRSLEGTSAHTQQRFYCDNFVDLMGSGLSAVVSADDEQIG